MSRPWDGAADVPGDVSLEAYSRALDEVYRLRQALAYEAAVTEAHLTLKSFPKSRRAVAEDQIVRMQAAARGDGAVAYSGTSHLSLKSAQKRAGMAETLTRYEWERSL